MGAAIGAASTPAVRQPAGIGGGRGKRKGPRPKHVPQRMCVACREHDSKRGLIRIVRAPDGAVALDPTGRANGRGAYLCHRPACWEKALKTGILNRALKTEIDEQTVVALRRHAATLTDPGGAPEPPGGAADEGGLT